MNYLTRRPSDRWRCVSFLWSSQGRTLSAWTDKSQSPFSCGSVKPASHETHISLWLAITYGYTCQGAEGRPLSLACWWVSRWSERLGEDSLMLCQTDGSEPTNALTLWTTWSAAQQTNHNHLIHQLYQTNYRCTLSLPLTNCRRRTGTGVDRRPTATSASPLASRQALPGPSGQRWRRRR